MKRFWILDFGFWIDQSAAVLKVVSAIDSFNPKSKIQNPKSIVRRGSAYVLVLSVSMIVLTIGVAAIAITRAQARPAGDRADSAQARLHAYSAIQLGRLMIAQDLKWRMNRANGVWIPQTANGDGFHSLEVFNPSGGLYRSPNDPVIMNATGYKGSAIQKTQVTLAPAIVPVTSLNTVMTGGSTISFNSVVVSGAGFTIASNANATANSSVVNANIQTVTTATGSVYGGTVTTGVAARTLPPAEVFDYYKYHGTTISYSSLASGQLRHALLSPAANPFGAANPQGIYVIDCAGQTITIHSVRIVGTLVLLNVGSGSAIQASVHLSPAIPYFPCLLVQGSFAVKTVSSDSLMEINSTANFNPPGTPYPYQGGTSNSTQTDIFPCDIKGLIYITGNLSTAASPVVTTMIAAGSISCSGMLTLNFDPALYQNPPPGFAAYPMPPLSGSWKQNID